MRSVYERENLKITEFDIEDVITTSGEQHSDAPLRRELENSYRTFNELNLPGSWW